MRRYLPSTFQWVIRRAGVTARAIARKRRVQRPVWISASRIGLTPRCCARNGGGVQPITAQAMAQPMRAAGIRHMRKTRGLTNFMKGVVLSEARDLLRGKQIPRCAEDDKS